MKISIQSLNSKVFVVLLQASDESRDSDLTLYFNKALKGAACWSLDSTVWRRSDTPEHEAARLLNGVIIAFTFA